MPRTSVRNGNGAPRTGANKYDAHHKVLSQTYGAFADLRRELSDSKTTVNEREDLLKVFASCPDSQRAWLALEDYFEKLSLSRRDFPATDWWPKMLAAQGKTRLEELAFLFLRAKRSVPPELQPHASPERFARAEEAEQEQRLVSELENWLAPSAPLHLDTPRATLRVVGKPQPDEADPSRHRLRLQFLLLRPRTGEKARSLHDLVDLVVRAAHEQELFTPWDWEFIQWIYETHRERASHETSLLLTDAELLQWLARWGNTGRLELAGNGQPIHFHGEVISLTPQLENGDQELSFTHRLALPSGISHAIAETKFFNRQSPIALIGNTFFLLRNAPPNGVLKYLTQKPSVPVRKLSHRLLLHLRKTQTNHGVDWDQLCVAHPATPQFVFELHEDTVQLRLMAKSLRDKSTWVWSSHEWTPHGRVIKPGDKPEILDDPRLDPAVQWLRKLDWFMQEPGLWIGDANENFLGALADAWGTKPTEAEFLGNPAFHHLFLKPRQLKPRLVVKGSGIDWLAVSAEWEAEGMKLSKADLERLAAATSRFVKLPNAGWVELDTAAVQGAHEAMADMGVDGLIAVPQKVGMEHVAHLDENELTRFADSPEAKALRERVREFRGVPSVELPKGLQAEMRPYQKDGFDFLCHLTQIRLGGILADDMGLGKTLQTLAWLLWLREQHQTAGITDHASRITHHAVPPILVVCPKSVMDNWHAEAAQFTPGLRVKLWPSGKLDALGDHLGEADLHVLNYAQLRLLGESLAPVRWLAVILDEGQYIKNPNSQTAQVARALQTGHRLVLTGTPIENRLLDLWSLMTFAMPGVLGSRAHFARLYDAKDDPFGRRRLSARVRPFLLRRTKSQVAKDLPDRIEEDLLCEIEGEQKTLYRAELKRAQQLLLAIKTQKELAEQQFHFLVSLLRLRQICCHPRLLKSNSAAPSAKTEALLEQLEPLMEEGNKVLVFSQFVEMLNLLRPVLEARKWPVFYLAGQTENRGELVRQFQSAEGPAIFLISLKAGGFGLNLTAASYVVLFDPWWNPAVENQAIDRTHRIGQVNKVIAYRLLIKDSIEEKIRVLQRQKKALAEDVLGEERFAQSLTLQDLRFLFAD